MHALHKHLSQTLADKLVKRGVVVWYDGRGVFKEFVAELTGENVPATCQVDTIAIDGKAVSLCVMQDSFFEAKSASPVFLQGGSRNRSSTKSAAGI